jgi:hypothetical protein
MLSVDSPATLGDMSSDGNVIVGNAPSGGFLWQFVASEPDPENPLADHPGSLMSFPPALAASGVDLTGWELEAPVAVSDDGRVVFGRAACGGVPTLYRWVVPR